MILTFVKSTRDMFLVKHPKTFVSDMLPDDDEEDDVKECLHDVDKKWHETGMTLVGLETDDRP